MVPGAFFVAAAGEKLLLLYKLLGGFAVAVVVVIGGLLLVRRTFRKLRHEPAALAGAAEPAPRASDPTAFMMATFQGVIKRMREQEKELERLHRLEKQRAEESEQMAATIMRNMATGLVMLNARGLITECNPAAKAVLGHQLLIGRSYREVFWPAAEGEAPPIIASLEQCLRTGKTFRRLQMTYQAPNNQNMVLGVGLSPIRTAEGAIAGAIVLLTDLTEIALLQQQVRLKENLAALGEMSAGIAHEFKNSLATISGYAQLISSASLEEAQKFSEKIVTETQFLTKIVTDFLNFSRPLNLVAAPVGLRDLIEDSFAEIRNRGDFPGVVLELCGEFPVVNGDTTLLRQAFSNLLRNGCEAMVQNRRGGHLQVASRVEPGENGPVVRLSFHDDGEGIARENLDKVFIPFFTTKNSGTGLGLALVHKIVVNHNGKIEVESTPGLGTTFTVTLPLAGAGG